MDQSCGVVCLRPGPAAQPHNAQAEDGVEPVPRKVNREKLPALLRRQGYPEKNLVVRVHGHERVTETGDCAPHGREGEAEID